MSQTAHEYCHQGRHEELTPAGHGRAIEYYRRAIEADPAHLPAYAEMSYVYVREYQNAWSPHRGASLNEALRLARHATTLADDPESAWHGDFRGRWYLAIVYWNLGDFDRSFEEFENARSLISPARRSIDEPDLDAEMAEALIYGGEPERAVEMIENAMRQKPDFRYWYWWNLGRARYMCRRYEAAIDAIGHIEQPPNDVRLITAASHAQLGHIDEAREIMNAFSAEDPDWTIEKSAAYPYRRSADRDHWIEGLRAAGLREN